MTKLSITTFAAFFCVLFKSEHDINPRMAWLKWIGIGVACTVVAACGASGASSTNFESPDDAGDVVVDAGGLVSDSGAPAPDSGTPIKPIDAGIDAAIDAGPTGNPTGFPCAKPSDCESGLCQPVIAGSGSVCVSTCTAQADCTDNFFCDPITAGSPDGYCVPHSPTHCAICSVDSDCGSLSEVCGTATGDTAKACHIDCSLAPIAGTTAACPSDYACESTLVDGVTRQVCMPKAPITNCVDAVGGFCDRVSTPQSCDRTNSGGLCVGARTCSPADNRYSSCDASAPACRACGGNNPVGCTENLCANAAIDVNNCGTCGNVCPGLSQANDNVSCSGAPVACTFSCQGESYDVDNSSADGCEITDPTTGNHTTGTAALVGDKACYDGSSNPNISGHLPSDGRVHTNAVVTGFDATSGSAPDFYTIHATGESSIFNPCTDNLVLTLTMTGSAHPACYHLHAVTDKVTADCDTSAAGTCQINNTGTGQYTDGSTIILEVYKTCSAAEIDDPTYTVTGHL